MAPIVNPCGEDDSLDRGALEANLTRLLATDVAGLYINGGTGDAANLTPGRAAGNGGASGAAPACRGQAGHCACRPDKPAQAVELARQAAALGAHAVASIPPKKPWPQIVEYYKALGRRWCAGDRVLYSRRHRHGRAGMPELRMLLDIPGVAGIKMSDWNIFLLRSVVLEYPEKVVYSGFDEMLVPGLLYGADGCIGTGESAARFICKGIRARARGRDGRREAGNG